MVKSVLGVNHQGFNDWAIQRLSAILMAIYFVVFLGYLMTHSGMSYAEWRGLFAPVWMKISTLVILLSLLFHAWVGMWTIFTDYVKPFAIRCVLDVCVILMLSACFIWGVMILWSV